MIIPRFFVFHIAADYSIGVSLNGFEFTDQADEIAVVVTTPITVVSVYPVAAFKYQLNITILVEAYPIPSNINLD